MDSQLALQKNLSISGCTLESLPEMVDELKQTITFFDQMIVSLLASAWKSETSTWHVPTLCGLMSSFARDVGVKSEHKIEKMVVMVRSGRPILDALSLTELTCPLVNDTLKIVTEKRQLNNFFFYWQQSPLAVADLIPYQKTFFSKLVRMIVTAAIALNVVVFVMLFIAPELSKLLNEYGMPYPAAFNFLLSWADRLCKLWFIPALGFFLLGAFYSFSADFRDWCRRWSPHWWIAKPLHTSVHDRWSSAWMLLPKLQPGGTDDQPPKIDASVEVGELTFEQQLLTDEILIASEAAALSVTDDPELKNWLLRNMVSSRQTRLQRLHNYWGTKFLGAGHSLIGFVVLVVAVAFLSCIAGMIKAMTGVSP